MCDCVATVDALLAERNTRLTQPLVWGERSNHVNLLIQTEVIEKKRGAKAVSMFASFCPFCGEEYGAPAEVTP